MKESADFPAVDPSTLEFLRDYGSETVFQEGSFILRRGEVGKAFYVVLSGVVEISVEDSEGDRLKLNELREGSCFGEISLLIESSVTADAVASTKVTALVCSKESFTAALETSPELSAMLSRGLAARLAANTTGLWSLHQHGKALNMLMGHRRRTEPLISASRVMGDLKDRLEELEREPQRAILLHGDAGTGKTFLASKIHQVSMEPYFPYIVFDCRAFCSDETVAVLFGSGFDAENLPGVKVDSPFRSFGAVDLAEGGTLVLRHIDALSLGSQEILLEYLSGIHSRRISPFQLVATSRKSPVELRREGLLHPGIEEIIGRFTIQMPPLHRRRKDILPLARHFLRKCEGQSVFRFSPAAEKKLLTYGFGNSNAAELKDMVETAVQISDGVEVEEDHLFTNRGSETRSVEFDLKRSPFLRRAVSPGALRLARIGVLAGFLAVVALSLLRPGHVEGQIANAAIWSLWEPLLFASFFVTGRVWCTVCPLSTAGKVLARPFRLDRPPPAWLKERSGSVLVAGFAAIIWSEHHFGMTARPFPSALLLIALFAAALLFSVLYRRESWCRYACPLGGLGAAYSPPAMLSVKANAHICSNYCSTYDCYKGREGKGGCPVGHHPLHDANGHNCKLCLSCLENCPHDAARLYLRPPLMSVWHSGPLGEGIVHFSFFLFFFSPAMLASKGGSWAATSTGFVLTTLLAVAGTFLTRRLAPSFLPRPLESEGKLLSRVALSLLVFAWGPLMAYQMHGIGVLSTFVIHTREGPGGGTAMGEITLLAVVQCLFILAAAVLGSFTAWRVRHEVKPFTGGTGRTTWKIIALICAIFVSLNIFIVARG